MKKILLTAVLLVIGYSVFSQEISKNALGIRLGSNDGFGGEISYQRALGSNNRLEGDLGWRNGNDYDGFKLTGVYQWVWAIENRFNWYAGVGAGLASFDYNYNPKNPNYDYKKDSDTFVFAAGNVGIEYNFEIPLLISLDFRPEFGFGHYNDDLDLDIALGLRYQF